MVWNRKHNLRVFFTAIMMVMAAFAFGQMPPDSIQTSQPTTVSADEPWSDKQWEESKRGIEYIEKAKKPQKENETKKEEYHYEPSRSNGFSLNSSLNSSTAKVIVIILIAAILTFVIIKFILIQKHADGKLKEKISDILSNIEDNLEEADITDFLGKAVEAGDYKTAVRLLYLSVIQRLNELKWIKWKKDKTNADFLMEMRGKQSFKIFRNLTLSYEIVWYGDLNIDRNDYLKIQKEFDEYKNKLVSGEDR